jgi:DNA-binding NarL/FixJ family response regulator
MIQSALPLKILILDDHLLFAEGLKAQLSNLAKSIDISIYADAAKYLRKVGIASSFDLIIVDLFMPDIHGIELISALRSRGTDTPILVISAATDINIIDDAFNKGANGFISKSTSPDTMLDAARQLLAGENYLDPNIPKTSKLLSKNISNDLKLISPRTSEVLQLLAKGQANKVIGDILNISEATVKWHVTQLFEILKVKNRTSCVAKAAKFGLIIYD